MNLKELKYVIYGEDRLSRKLDNINGASTKVNRTLNTTTRNSIDVKRNFKDFSNEIPFLNRGLQVLTNPLTITAGLFAGLSLALNKAKNEAAAFNNEYRELINLNLDKSPFQRDFLKANVLDTAFKQGFDPLKTSTAYYDVQSITGKYGYDVQKVVEKAGMFARVMRSDFNQTISGTAQAMDIFGIKSNQLDDYLASLYKTVMVGKTTFDELTRVQVEYANAAASAGQDYNSANKIFAAFSKTEKTVDIAANKTKTAFEDLTKKSTLVELGKQGVKVFDSNDKMLKVEDILENLIPKLKTMSDLEFANLKEEIGGSEGLRGLLDTAKNKSDQLLESFRLFDATDFDMTKALKEAREDVNFLNDEINSKLKVSWIKLGEATLPVWVSIKETVLDVIDSINDRLYTFLRSYYRVFDKDQYHQLGQIRAEQSIQSGFGVAKDMVAHHLPTDLKAMTEAEKNELIKTLEAEKDQLALPNTIAIGTDITDLRNELTGKEMLYAKVIKALKNDNAEALYGLFDNYTSGFNTDDDDGSGGDNNPTNDKKSSNIFGGGTQQRNVTVNINSLIQDQNINVKNLTEAAPEIEDKIVETVIRAINGAEQVMN